VDSTDNFRQCFRYLAEAAEKVQKSTTGILKSI